MEKDIGMAEKAESLEREGYGPRLFVDFLCCLLVSSGISLALFSAIGFGVSMAGFLLCLAAAAAVLVCSRRWWLAPVIALAALTVYFAAGLLRHSLRESAGHISGFLSWCLAGLPEQAPYSGGWGPKAVQLGVALGVTSAVFVVIRRLYFPVLAAATAGVYAALCAAGFSGLAAPMALSLAGLLIALPGVFGAWAKKRLGSSGKGYSLFRMQLTALPLAAFSVLVALAVTSGGTESWRSEYLLTRIADLNEFIVYHFGAGINRGGFSLAYSGYQPLVDRLGGSIDPNDAPILTVTCDAEPPLLRGSVYDYYTGSAWTESKYDGEFRFKSVLWRGQRRSVFGFDKPDGGSRARAAYERLVSEVSLKLIYEQSNLNTVFSGGGVQSVVFPYEVYFNSEGELFTDEKIPRGAAAVLSLRVPDRSKPGFDGNMYWLEQLETNYGDSDYEEIARRCLQLPDSLPDSVRALASELTEGLNSPYARALALEDWLADNCVYSLTPGDPPAGEDFVAGFLEARQGYCTYYASAMTVLARCAGLPARYVTGYGLKADGARPGVYVATSRTAHAWTEVYFKGIGWVVFNPGGWDASAIYQTGQTEESALADKPAEPEPSAVPSAAPQTPATSETPEPAAQAIPAVSPRVVSWTLFFLLCAVFLWLALLLLPVLRRYGYSAERVLRKYGISEEALLFYYRDIVRQLECAGVPVEGGDTFLTYAARADAAIGLDAPANMANVASSVMLCRYALTAPGYEDIGRACRCHRALEDYLKKRLSARAYFLRRVIFR